VSAEITRLGAIKVVILGGTAVVTTTVETALNTLLAN
jgi:putative cell wall-binding protein